MRMLKLCPFGPLIFKLPFVSLTGAWLSFMAVKLVHRTIADLYALAQLEETVVQDTSLASHEEEQLINMFKEV